MTYLRRCWKRSGHEAFARGALFGAAAAGAWIVIVKVAALFLM